MDWARGEAKTYGMAMHGGSGTAEELNRGVTNIGRALHQWTEVMHKCNELDAKTDEKDTKRAKSGSKKLAPFIRKMIFHALVLLAPKDIDILSEQIDVFLVMCWVIFGTNSGIVKN
jgi:hypothetical protein